MELISNTYRKQIYQHTWPDGTLAYYDIDRATEAAKNLPVHLIDLVSSGITLEAHRKQAPDVSEEYAQTTDILDPVLLLMLENGEAVFIDGNHRLRFTLMLGLPEILARILPAESIPNITMTRDEYELAKQIFGEPVNT